MKQRMKVTDVVSWLVDTIAMVSNQGETCLPGIRELAGQVGCAPATMVKAVAHLTNQGCLKPVRHMGTYILSSPKHDELPKTTMPTPTETVESRIVELLVAGSGCAPSGTLLRQKELAAILGVGIRRIRPALDNLCTRGIVSKTGSRYCVPRPKSKSRLKVVVIAVGDNQGEPQLHIPHCAAIFQNMESHARELDIELETVLISRGFGNPYPDDSQIRNLTEATSDPRTAGFVLWHMQFSPRLEFFLAHLLDCSKPVAVLNDAQNQALLSVDKLPSRWHFFPLTNSPLSGKIVGQQLLLAGHRRIAFVMDGADSPFAQQRFEGVREVFQKSGTGRQVVVVRPISGTIPNYQAIFSHLRIPIYNMLEKEIIQITHTPPSEIFDEDEIQNLLTKLSHRFHDHDALDMIVQKALEDTTITACVGANDFTSVLCLLCLQKAHRRFSRNIALVSFDDGFSALRYGITSYNFAIRELTHAALSYVLHPQILSRSRADKTTEIAGYLTIRKTFVPNN